MPSWFSVASRRALPAASGRSLLPLAVNAAQTDPHHLLNQLETHPYGLTAVQARQRRRQFGPNEIAHDTTPAWYQQLFRAFNSPFVYLLLVLAIAAWLTRDLRGAALLLGIVLLSGVLRFAREYRSSRAAEKLRALVETTATVSRYDDLLPAERRQEVPIRKLVPGDVVHLAPGDMVPADVRLLEANHFFVGQSILTGESDLVQKYSAVRAATSPNGDWWTLPNLCFMGTTVLGGSARAVVIATGAQTYLGRLSQALIGRRSPTSFDTGINQITWLLIGFIAIMAPSAVLLNGLVRGQWTTSLIFGVAVAVGLVPELLPLILSIGLTRGVSALAQQQMLAKRLDAVQNLGAVDLLCTDKTGTLTQNQVSFHSAIAPLGQSSPDPLADAYLNSYYQTGIQNRLDDAILEAADASALSQSALTHRKLGEVPFDFARRRLSVVVEQEGFPRLICKGAVEEVLGLCSYIQHQGEPTPLTEALHQQTLQTAQQFSQQGFRVLAVACKRLDAPQDHYDPTDEAGLRLVGYLTFLDPPQETAKGAIAALQQYNVHVKVLTGDNEHVARTICQEVGLPVQQVCLGSAIDPMSDEELAAVAENTTLFAKLSPLQKARIVQVLKQQGHTVGYLGDGVNDALALREADVGISVESAVDVAKESADVILLEKSLLVLEQGIVEGRRTFGNIIKYLKMATSSNFGNVLSVMGASALLPFLPMQPLQLLVQNLLYDLSQTAIPFDRVDESYLAQPQRWSVGDLRRFMLCLGPVSSMFDYVTFAVLWGVLGFNVPADAALFQSGWFVYGLLSQTLIIHLIRTAKAPFTESTAALPVLGMTGLVMAIALLLPFTSVDASIGLVPLPARYFLWLFAILLGYWLVTRGVKAAYIRRFKTWL
ncbi:magnesium-translocating P-type ATPase [Thermoleptolyngbya sp. PKUAC-SCTB121]|uniref:magnesium-translocating P-type ATPase n=1 Tax=Thermoleptolyngbya sp. PKUAC-SCTB121 TaxID=2811482 RepID=UPI001964595A|nr:magnesium-translocating P-type ATPase [Thermoleptolyngbya sp. PKUAC-SCTB121]